MAINIDKEKLFKIDQNSLFTGPTAEQQLAQAQIATDFDPRVTLTNLPLPQIAQENIHVNSDQFKDILNRYKRGGKSGLTPAEYRQLIGAAENIDGIDQYITRVDSLKEQVDEVEKREAEQPEFPEGSVEGFNQAMAAGSKIKSADLERLPEMLMRSGRQFDQWLEEGSKLSMDNFGTLAFFTDNAEVIAKGLLKFPPEMLNMFVSDTKKYGPGYAAVRMSTAMVDFFVNVGQDIATVVSAAPVVTEGTRIARQPGISQMVEQQFDLATGREPEPLAYSMGPSPDEVAEQWKKDPTPLILAALPVLKIASAQLGKYAHNKSMVKEVDLVAEAMERTLKRTEEIRLREEAAEVEAGAPKAVGEKIAKEAKKEIVTEVKKPTETVLKPSEKPVTEGKLETGKPPPDDFGIVENVFKRKDLTTKQKWGISNRIDRTLEDLYGELRDPGHFIYKDGKAKWDAHEARNIIIKNPRKPVMIDAQKAWDWRESVGFDAVKEPSNVAKAKSEVPVFVVNLEKPLNGINQIVIDGWHRIRKALDEGKKEVPAFVLDKAESAKIVLEGKDFLADPAAAKFKEVDVVKIETKPKKVVTPLEKASPLAPAPQKVKTLDGQRKKTIDAKKEDVSRNIFLEELQALEERAAGITPGALAPGLEKQVGKKMKMAVDARGTDIADAPSILVERTPKDLGPSSFIRTFSNLFGITPGQPARYGFTAQKAARDIILTDWDIMRKSAQDAAKLDKALEKVDRKKDWGDKGAKFYDHIVDPTKDGQLQPGSLEAVKTIRKYMEDTRKEIISIKRDNIRNATTKLVNREWRAANDLTNKKLKPEQQQQLNEAVEAGIKERVPDDWGIDNYLPQIHSGNYQVIVDIAGESRSIGTARTASGALDRALEHYADHPEISPDSYTIQGRAFRGPDVTRTSEKNLFRIVNEIAEAAEGITRDQVANALTGKIGAKERKTKFTGFLQERTGVEGFSKNTKEILASYVQGINRWKYLTALNKRIQPMIEMINAERRPRTAAHIQGTLDHLWGRSPSELSLRVDAALQKLPGVRDLVKPQFMERALGHIKGGVVMNFLTLSPRFHFLNRLQRYQTLAPVIKGLPHTSDWKAGTAFYNSPEGKAAMEQFGIKHITRGKFLEAGKARTSPELREKLKTFAPETSNQQIAWTTMYQKAKKMGMDDIAANDYAFLRGNLYSQFAHLKSDVPIALRGPIASTIFQFKRFPIKNLELAYDLISQGNFPGVGKWIGAQLAFGGAKIGTSLPVVGGTVAYITNEMYQDLKNEYGDAVADVFAFGLPGLIGLDMSYSIQMLDLPYGESVAEQIGNVMLGPAGNVVTSVASATLTDDEGFEKSELERAIKALGARVPSLRWIETAYAVSNKIDQGKYNFEDPKGRVKFEGDMRDVIVKSLAGRTVKEGEMDIVLGALTHVTGQRDKALNEMVLGVFESIEKGEELDFTTIYDWNELWPEFPITNDAIKTRYGARYKAKDLDRVERALRSVPKQIKATFQQQGQ